MLVLASTFLLLAVATAATDRVDATETSTTAPPLDDNGEARDLAILALIEGELSVGRALSRADTAKLIGLLDSPSPIVRATAAAVLPWLEVDVAVRPLIAATRDSDPRVRATAAVSLVPLARRLVDDDRTRAVDAALVLVNGADDEAACAGAELLAAVRTDAVSNAFADAAKDASDARYACLARFGGLPVRAVTLPPRVERPDDDVPAATAPAASPDVVAAAEPVTQWIFVANAAAAGMLMGGAIPAALVPARDVLVYDDDETRNFRQDVSFATTAGAAVVGGALLGGGAWALDHAVGPLPAHEALAVVGGTGSGLLLGDRKSVV